MLPALVCHQMAPMFICSMFKNVITFALNVKECGGLCVRESLFVLLEPGRMQNPVGRAGPG